MLDRTDARLLDADPEAAEGPIEDKDDFQDENLAEESFFHMNPTQVRAKRKSAQNSRILERTWIDVDDDEDEFDDAISEENDDMRKHDISAFMVSRKKLDKFQDELSRKLDGVIPNKILDSHIL